MAKNLDIPENLVERLWAKDATLWSGDRAVQRIVRNRLGWLEAPTEIGSALPELEWLVGEVRGGHFTDICLLGMGGSSLCPDLWRRTFKVTAGHPRLHVIDTTDPEFILEVDRSLDISKTFFVVSSKSGTTVEVQALFKYFRERDTKPSSFAAITDAGTTLDELATEKNFRHIFRNPSDIGGRYSALTYFGLVPAALMGLDVAALLSRARAMARLCKKPIGENPGVDLGISMAKNVLEGRDKMAVVLPRGIEALGGWIEQLVAESTGKQGKGVVPVVVSEDDEPTTWPADHFIVPIVMKDPYEMAGEFFRWEVATAVCGALLGVNPFDEPNVGEAKKQTGEILEAYEKKGSLEEGAAICEGNGFRAYADPSLHTQAGELEKVLEAHLGRAKTKDYVSWLAYFPSNDEGEKNLKEICRSVRNRWNVAVTGGFGPRYLHSTGQLHKGGSDHGVFVLLTRKSFQNIDVPREKYSFGVLQRAQAIGDFRALVAHGRRVLRIDFDGDAGSAWGQITKALEGMSGP